MTASPYRPRARGAIRAAVLLMSLAAATFAGCAETPSPTVSPSGAPADPTEPDVALACWGILPADCRRIAAEGLARRIEDGGVVTAVAVRDGRLRAESSVGPALLEAAWSAEPGEPVVFGGWEDVPSARVTPASLPMAGPETPLTLGHCGLDSPIDADASLWDPVGTVDTDATEAINSADGRIRLTGPLTAEFVAPSGFRVALRRHPGAKAVPLCD